MLFISWAVAMTQNLPAAPAPAPAHEEITDWKPALAQGIKQLGGGILAITPKDVAEYCPKWPKLSQDERSEVLAVIMGGMIGAESGGNTATEFRECSKSKNVYGREGQYKAGFGWCMMGGDKAENGYVISRGLFQISLGSAKGYKCEGIEKPSDLHDPQKNINCAVKIMSKLVVENKRLSGKQNGSWQGGARYWSTLRDFNDASRLIKKYALALKICK